MGWRCCVRASGVAREMPKPALAAGRGADRRLRARASRTRSAPDRRRAGSHALGWTRRLAQRGLALPPSARALDSSQAALARRRLPGAPYASPREPAPERHVEASRPGELVGVDCFFVGRLHGTKGAVWQLTAIDVASSFAWAELVSCPSGQPATAHTSQLARRVAGELKAAGWRLERVLSDNGGEFRGAFNETLASLGIRQTRIHAGRPQTNGAVEALHKTILDECWRPAFAHLRLHGLKRELERYLAYYNFDRAHTGRLTRGRIPADIVYGARKMEAR
jgi:transposase InsO family protein